MSEQIYEHHLAIKQNKLCPFKLAHLEKISGDSLSNWHKNIELLYFVDGTAYVQYGAEDFFVQKDDFVIVNSGILHRPHKLNALEYYLLIIDEEFCNENGIDIENCIFEKHFSNEKTKKLLFNVIREYDEKEKNSFSALRIRTAVLELLIDLCTNHIISSDISKENQRTSEQYVKTALEYLNSHFNEEISLDMLASMCNVTKFYLSREFKKYTGQTIFTYATMLKCKKAQNCLSEGMTVTETAFACGFESVSYFSQTYKKIMGVSPSSAKKGLV